jgi:hypothetical protein
VTGAGFTRWWAGCYTRGLPVEAREARRAEIESDVFEQQAAGGSAAAIVGRTLRGAADDLLWRYSEGRAMNADAPTGMRAAWAAATQAWFTPVAVLLALFNFLAALAVLRDPNGKMPGQVIGPLVLTTLGIAILAGLWMRWRRTTEPSEPPAAPSRWSRVARVALGLVAALAVAAMVVGISPLFALAALVVLVLAVVLWLRTAHRGVLADVLIVAGALPALSLWWLIVPAVMALVVIGGVLGTGRREQTLTSGTNRPSPV